MSLLSAHLMLDVYITSNDSRLRGKMLPESQSQAFLALAHFPCEVVRNLTQYLHCCDILNLWQSGCARLRALFSQQGGVQQLTLATSAYRNLRIPALVYQLDHLEHLCVRLIVDPNVFITGLNLKELPKSLKSLDISVDDLYRVFMDPMPIDESIGGMIVLKDTLPKLERLSLVGNMIPLAEIPEILFSDNLTALRLHSYRIASFDFNQLPPHLTSLHLEGVSHQTKSNDNIGTPLPVTLQAYCGDIHVNSGQYALPPTLTHLNSSFSASNKTIPFPSLPETLKRVEFCLGYNMKFTEHDAEHLPSHLTELLCHYMEDMPSEGIKHWTQLTLRKLVLPPGSHLTDELVGLLPRSLTHLDMNYQANISESMVLNLPPLLEVLHCSLLALRATFIAALPRSIRRLSLLYIAQSCANYLPPSIESLKVMKTDLCGPMEESTKFPESLVCFQADIASQFDAMCLPRRLKTLDLGSVDLLSDSAAKHFPPTLTELHLRGAFQISDRFFQELPTTHLRTFSCFTSQGDALAVTDETIQHLPSSLTKVALNMPSITGKSAQLLPRRLKHLSLLRSTRWSDENLQDLPPGLETVELPSAMFSVFCARLLPPQVRKFTSAGHPKFTQIVGIRPIHPPIWTTDGTIVSK